MDAGDLWARISGRLGRAGATCVLATTLAGTAMAQSLPPAPVPGVGGASEAQLAVRVDMLESQLRTVTGQMEQLSFQVQQLNEQLRRFSEDTEYRFQELGQAGGPPPSSATLNVAPQSLQMQQQPQQPLHQQSLNQPQFAPQFVPSPGAAQRGAPPQNLGVLNQPVGQQPLNINPIAGVQGTQPFGNSVSTAPVALGVDGGPRTSYDVAYAYILQRDYDAAEGAFADFLSRYEDNELAGNAQYWLGESYYARGRYRDAAAAFLKGYEGYKSSQKAPDSLLKLGMSLKELGQTKAACASFGELSTKFPNASRALRERAQAERRRAGC